MNSNQNTKHSKIISVPGSKLKMHVDNSGFLFGLESILLIDFVPNKTYHRAIDLGCGDGILALRLAETRHLEEIWAVELNETIYERSNTNIALNGYTGCIKLLHKDIRKLRGIFQHHSFDLVITNPPFFEPETDYRCGNDHERFSRQCFHGGLRQFIQVAGFLLKQKADLVVLYHPSRLDVLIAELLKTDFQPKTLQILYHQDGRALFVFLHAAYRGKSGLTILPPKILPSSYKREINC
ncbi:methyltransferase [bacterium]|nr:methyltransferase [candidate division CSSED10-310 bacterium]